MSQIYDTLFGLRSPFGSGIVQILISASFCPALISLQDLVSRVDVSKLASGDAKMEEEGSCVGVYAFSWDNVSKCYTGDRLPSARLSALRGKSVRLTHACRFTQVRWYIGRAAAQFMHTRAKQHASHGVNRIVRKILGKSVLPNGDSYVFAFLPSLRSPPVIASCLNCSFGFCSLYDEIQTDTKRWAECSMRVLVDLPPVWEGADLPHVAFSSVLESAYIAFARSTSPPLAMQFQLFDYSGWEQKASPAFIVEGWLRLVA